MPQDLNAGMVSFKGLVPLFGTTGSNGTSETEIGLMSVTSLNNWLGRLSNSTYKTCGPTGAWATEWFSVWNYLQYGGSCVIGGTGSTGAYYSSNGSLGITLTPLHNKNLVNLDVVFDGGNTFSIGAATNISTTRQDCVAVIGNYKDIATINMSSAYAGFTTDFGVTAGSNYVICVAGRKKFTYVNNSVATVYEGSLSADVAGCFARTSATENIWMTPAGYTRGRILNVLYVTQKFSDSDISYFSSGGVNAITAIPGQGTFLLTNNTSYLPQTSSLAKINVMMLVLYLKKELTRILKQFLFENNSAALRQQVINATNPTLVSIQATNGISTYTLTCDTSNNTDQVIAAGNLVLDVSIDILYPATTIVIRVTNSATGEVLIS
jgi:Phage tail sheath protein subtilisin-like domain/Phage tail sheath C-terminal domain